MSQVRFIADYHFGHEICATKFRGFKNADEMNEHIIKEHNKIVNKKDLTYILGDITMETDKWYFLLDQMNGRKKVILGNHDDPKHVLELLKYVESVGSMIKYKGCFVTHCPIHPQELEYRVSKNIHGHLHKYSVVKEILPDTRDTSEGTKDDRYIGVSCEQVNYQPKTLEELGIIR
jgi:calcineurin-like phosphoesterase family protein